ncbi:DNA-binding transcriptional LysR family regulator [Rhodococcus fascians]|jgi:DNA-binding transcriptional LysR family regulator|uniref:LysR family transcriptional regulator n=1 Tax=Nocardiaceae TaxID=85025 RepID=UPI00050CE2B9|nr:MULTISPECIES: LysR family transcriptional regulator [Rhodococcus]MBJ7324812.1 LysR family transcriptional regulator [Rhodococcus sp. (in: high G+C Gram-positive bacteria)]MCX6489783.1 LysR family transcriptional regulator [Rhodococcus sp. (in: high G+C Gram-positive bacteria)]MDJ0426171.1 LysR family transcriptional regulator [Rhodococcus fascians]MDR6909793.1 DNA-binding transcriptional LysR family regulator [Rhodococcus sp. 3258]MDR6931561.1 DNA-binding transcriptional LysR family regulat
MELRQLEYFVAVAEEANFTRAAARVHISQSGVSAQIRALERELGAELIDRSGGTATLTTAGQAALPQARATLAAAGSVKQSVDDVTGLLRGRLSVGMVTACTVPPLFDALAGFHAAHPGVDIALREGNSDDLVADVRSGELDLALVGLASRTPAGLESMVVIDERIVAAVPAEHPLAAQKDATLAEVCEYPIVALPPGTGIRAVFDRDCAGGGLSPSITLQASAPDAVADLATRGLGVGILSRSMAEFYGDRLVAIELTDSHTAALLALVWRSAMSPALAELVGISTTSFSESS